MVKDCMMPDLVYEPSDVETFKDQWRKCYYTDKYFTSTFHGGTYKHDVNPYNENGELYENLVSGTYRLVAVAQTPDGEILAQDDFSLDINVNEEKTMSRFSPSEHFNNVAEQAAEHDYAMYVDLFPGMFSNAGFEGWPDDIWQIRMDRKWKLMDIQEYLEGRVHYYIYNVSVDSSTYSVEGAAIQETQSIDNPARLISYYYDIGDLNVGGRKGEFVRMADGQKLKMIRADFPTLPSYDNHVNVSDLENIVSHFDLSTPIVANADQTISMFGAVTFIQNTPEDIIFFEELSSYELRNRILTLVYHITGDDIDYTIEKQIGLVREADGGETYSLMEFKHDFRFGTDMSGKSLTVSTQAYDVNRTLVPNSEDSFTIQVQ